MSPERAIDYIKSFGLPEIEEQILIECDVHKRPYSKVGFLGLSEGMIRDRKRKAYQKIADGIEYRKERGQEK